MRPINSMIEFKQIIGRGTRLFEGKDYFTIYDFVKAHQHFNDPTWDGEADDVTIDPEPRIPEPPNDPDDLVDPPAPRDPQDPPGPKKIRAQVKLADGKARAIQHMVATTFWHADGTPMSAQQFMELLFGKLPEFFKNEDELRTLWSDPETRAKLLIGLAEKGFGGAQLSEMQKIIDAENSDLFDVLAYVAYASPMLSRQERATQAKRGYGAQINYRQQAFIDFVLSHYVNVGVEELSKEKLTPLLRLKYHDSIADAVADLGRADEIGRMFAGFQRYLYVKPSARDSSPR
jgi:type I restriction enzyme R subunit